MDTVVCHDCRKQRKTEEDLGAKRVSVCKPQSVCLGLLWKRFPFHTRVNEGAGHMDGRKRRERRRGGGEAQAKREET